MGEGEPSTEYIDSSKLAAEVEDSIGLVTEGCVRLGEEETRDSWSCVDGVVAVVVVAVEGAGGCEGVVVTTGVGFVTVVVDVGVAVVVVGGVECWVAPAAAAEYRIGVNVSGRGCWGRPALRMLDIGCCVKFGGGGGFAVGVKVSGRCE